MGCVILTGIFAFHWLNATHHHQRAANILFSDSHTVSRPNRDGRYLVDLSNYADIGNAFDKILKVLEQADTEF